MLDLFQIYNKLTLVIFCLCSTSCVDDTTSDIDYKCTQGDCRNGFGTAVYVNGDEYVGEWKDNKMHGQGTLTYTDGAKYVGERKDDKKHGKGTFTFPDGIQYSGEWKDDEMLPKGSEQ